MAMKSPFLAIIFSGSTSPHSAVTCHHKNDIAARQGSNHRDGEKPPQATNLVPLKVLSDIFVTKQLVWEHAVGNMWLFPQIWGIPNIAGWAGCHGKYPSKIDDELGVALF